MATAALNPATNSEIMDGPDALRPSPDSDIYDDVIGQKHQVKTEDPDDSQLSEVPEPEPTPAKKKRAAPKKEKAPAAEAKTESKRDFAVAAMTTKAALNKPSKSGTTGEERGDPEDDAFEDADPEEIKQALSRPPPVNSDYLPLPWKGRLGYACLNTYLRNSNPPVFQSRTTRIASILEHRHPLKDPSQPEHPIKNRPDKEQPADIRRGQEYVEQIALANCRDMIKMVRWNDRYNIKFFRLSSEAFPFASHAEYGYKLAPFASEALAEVGKVIAELGHRVSTHPGQFTQLGSPRDSVIKAAFADLEFHDEFLSLLKLPPQQDRDAVMVLHMGGTFGDKAATLDRFRTNYSKLSDSVKRRLVLENDDMCWGVHDLLPICEELGIPMVLDWHHHNIIFDNTKIREGSYDMREMLPQIKQNWDAKQITQKMHYSEPTPAAITGSQRRKHNPRVWSLPPCPDDMDLMIEAKDKEQAVFELMRTFKLPGFNKIGEVIPHTREDDNKPIRPVRAKKAAPKKKKGKNAEDEAEEDVVMEDAADANESTGVIPEEEVGMGGPDGRVYWPMGMEEWLRPVKRVVVKKDPADKKAPAKKTKAAIKAEEAEAGMTDGSIVDGESAKDDNASTAVEDSLASDTAPSAPPSATKAAADKKAKRAAAGLPTSETAGVTPSKPKASRKPAAKKVKKEPTPEDEEAAPSPSEMSDSEIEDRMEAAEKELHGKTPLKRQASRASGRAKAQVTYKEEAHSDVE